MNNEEMLRIALRTTNHVLPATIAYWDAQERCVFANDAYLEWFGRTAQEMRGLRLEELLGPIYVMNRPYVLKVLAGESQVFERGIPTGTGENRECMVTYTPDIVDGVVLGFSVHVADVTIMKRREEELRKTIAERDRALSEVRTLEGLLPICSGCRRIRDSGGEWHSLEKFVTDRTDADFTHGICADCKVSLYPELYGPK